LKVYIADTLKLEADPDRTNYGHLQYPPFFLKLDDLPLNPWGDLKIEGYVKGKKVIARSFSGKGIDAQLILDPDDTELTGDGIDVTRVVMRVADSYGNTQQFASGSLLLSIDGPGEIIGENPFALMGGAGAIWIKTKQAAGSIRFVAKHQYLGSKEFQIRVTPGVHDQI
jgi:beta-galactosidase